MQPNFVKVMTELEAIPHFWPQGPKKAMARMKGLMRFFQKHSLEVSKDIQACKEEFASWVNEGLSALEALSMMGFKEVGNTFSDDGWVYDSKGKKVSKVTQGRLAPLMDFTFDD